MVGTLRRGGSALESVPHQIKQILRDETWRHFVTRLGKEVRHERFADFVTTPPLAGLGADIALVRRLVADDVEALDLLDRALQNPVGAHLSRSDSDVITISRDPNRRGTSRAYALRKLRKDASSTAPASLAGLPYVG